MSNRESSLRDELLGHTVDSYRLEQRLGGGAMASVYRATDLNSGEQVALKLLLPGADQAMRERFHREMRTVSHLNHPNIVRTVAVSSYNGNEAAYIAMELVEGESLGQLLERSGQLSMIDSCALLAAIARALAYAHQQGIIHRDVKPSNILLRRSTWGDPNAVRIAAIDTPVVPLLSDFGIALVLDAPELTSAGRTIGTPAYMAPEQCSGSREVDGRADIYALGAVLFRCLIGHPLFLGNTTQILHAHVYDPVVIPDDNMRLLSPLVVEILAMALAKEPEERYEDAGWLAEDLAVAAGQRVRSAARKSTASEATATMSSLPTANASTRTSSHVLVPAPKAKNERKSLDSASMEVLPEEDPVIPLIPPKTKNASVVRPEERRHQPNWRRSGRWLATAIVALLGLTAVSLALIMWPRPNTPLPPPATAATEEAIPTVAVAIAPATEVSLATSTEAVSVPTMPATEALSSTLEVTVEATSAVATVATVEPTEPVSTPSITPTLTPTLSLVDAKSALIQAQTSFEAGEWSTAVEFLVQLHQGAPNYSPDSVSELLGNSYLLLAAGNNQRGAYTETIELLNNGQKFLEGQPVAESLRQLSNRTLAVLLAETQEARDAALQDLQKVHQNLASQLVDEAQACASLVHLNAAKAIREDVSIDVVEAQYQGKCAQQRDQRNQQNFLATLTGNMLYSSQSENDSKKVNIYRQSVTKSEPPTLLIANARFPAQQQNSAKIAYYNTASAAGMYEFDPTQTFDPTERGRALATEFTEDGSDSPSSWNLTGDLLVFSTLRESDRRDRLFVYVNDGSLSTYKLVEAKAAWPAWRPLSPNSRGDWIVFNGTNEGGNEPGMWLVTRDGMPITRLTDNGDDIAPAWTPDGSALFFMNANRSGNWDIYQVAVGNEPKLTTPIHFIDSPSVDIMPTVSPDGKALAFVSDRGGQWQIWVVPIEGGEPFALVNLEGKITDPTKQSMQWVR